MIRFEVPRRAAPGYVTEILGDRHTLQSRDVWQAVPPGHRFHLFFHGMADKGEVDAPGDRQARNRLRNAAERADWEILRRSQPRFTDHWIPLKIQKRVALQAAAGMGETAADLLDALAARARALHGPNDWTRDAVLAAPLATGLGNPHPVENGFAFLAPYGVPYLAGSGVKGVLRRAAEELALFNAESPWDLAHVWALFGFDENSAYLSKRPEEMSEKEREKVAPVLEQQMIRWREAYERWAAEQTSSDPVLAAWKRAIDAQLPTTPRSWCEASPEELAGQLCGATGASLRRAIHWQGMLAIQDAFPGSEASLEVDILNPHHKDYYEAKSVNGHQATPHDAENPVPVFFLTVAPGARFHFSAVPLPGRDELWRTLGDWNLLLDAAFDHAREWLGFGAKTAVGYGAMDAVVTPQDDTQDVVSDEPKTEEERLIAALRATLALELREGTLSPNGRVASDRTHLLRTALEWDSVALRVQAAELIEETVRRLPWSKKARAQRQGELARLRKPK